MTNPEQSPQDPAVAEIDAFLRVLGTKLGHYEKQTREAAIAAWPRAQSLSAGRGDAQLVADCTYQAKLLVKLRDNLINIKDEIEDEGDRAYFGSTNDADTFREIVDALDDYKWSLITERYKGRDLYAEMRELRERAEKAEAAPSPAVPSGEGLKAIENFLMCFVGSGEDDPLLVPEEMDDANDFIDRWRAAREALKALASPAVQALDGPFARLRHYLSNMQIDVGGQYRINAYWTGRELREMRAALTAGQAMEERE